MEHNNTERRLHTWVHLPGPNGEYVSFGPSDHPLPTWAIEALADNPRVWRSDDDEPDDAQAAAPSLIGHEFEPGSMVSGPMMTTSALPPSSTPMAHPSRGTGRPQAPAAGAEPGMQEARRRFGRPPGDAA